MSHAAPSEALFLSASHSAIERKGREGAETMSLPCVLLVAESVVQRKLDEDFGTTSVALQLERSC